MSEIRQPFRGATRADVRSRKPPQRAREWARGEPITARHLNDTVRAINRNLVMGAPREPFAGSGLAPAVYEARIVEELRDFVDCRLRNGQRILVLKPLYLRASWSDGYSAAKVEVSFPGFNGSPVQRVAGSIDSTNEPDGAHPRLVRYTGWSDGDLLESQIIAPAYLPGLPLMVSNQAVTLQAFRDAKDAGFIPETVGEFFDLNVDGRQWCAQWNAEPWKNPYTGEFDPSWPVQP